MSYLATLLREHDVSRAEKLKALGLEGKRYRPCTCGLCGIVWDTREGYCVAIFVGPEDKEQPISREIQQRNMVEWCRAVNAEECRGTEPVASGDAK